MLLNLGKSRTEHKEQEPLFSAAPTSENKRNAAWLASRIERAKMGKSDEMETETVVITPALAELMLVRNLDNRPVREKRVRQLADTIREGHWRLTSQGISFSRDGGLNDGQHRLKAIVAAGVAVPCRVTFGEDRDVFDVLDTHAGRTGGDVLAIAGYTYWNLLAAAARIYTAVMGSTPWRVQNLSNEDILEIISVNPGMEAVCRNASDAAKKLKCSSGAVVAAFYIIRQQSKSADRLDEFARRLANGEDLAAKNPIRILRNLILTGHFAAGRVGSGITSNAVLLAAAIVMAWNRWIAGKSATVKSMRWSPQQEFPSAE